MQVKKRNGSFEDVKFDKINYRINKLTYGLNTDFVDYHEISKKVINGIYDGISTEELDILSAETAQSMSIVHPDYSLLAGRISVSNLHKRIPKKFSQVAKRLYEYVNPKTGEKSGMIADDVYKIIKKNAKALDAMIILERDFNFNFFSYRTLEKSYLLKIDGRVAESPQHLLMRMAVGIHGDDLENVQKTYNMVSEGLATHATPTLFNAGTKFPQMSSCFLTPIQEDSMEGIYKTLKDCAIISKSAGGIGVSIHNIRAKDSYIKGTNGTSNGLVPMLRVYNDTARYSDQGGGKRPGAFAMYLEPWHADIMEFLDLKKNHGAEEMRARDLFYAMWIPDLFMQRVAEDGYWTLFCPNEAPNLHEVYDEHDDKQFTKLYEKYVNEGLGRVTVKAKDIWHKILENQIETGTPYILFKDHANRKSNQKNVGIIKSSNLCTEILEVSTSDETAVCNLASIALPKFVNDGEIDHKGLFECAKQLTFNLNKVIDKNYYPTPETKKSNMRHRPIGIGVQGLADVFAMMGVSFTSDVAKKTNKEIFETIYFGALTESNNLAKTEGHYETFKGSPLSEGKFQFDMWDSFDYEKDLSGRWEWENLRQSVVKHGTRNSLLLAPMPTASTAQILGNNECFEPYTSNLYKRKVRSGEFIVSNKYLIDDLVKLGLWNEETLSYLVQNDGSVQDIPNIPSEIKEKYKTVWELKQKDLIEMSRDRGYFIDQSQSFNIFFDKPTFSKLHSAHFHSWKVGLKTGMYYLRRKSESGALKDLGFEFKNNKKSDAPINVEKMSAVQTDNVCSLDDPDCEACSA